MVSSLSEIKMKQVAVNFNRRRDLMVRRVDWQQRTRLWSRVLDVLSKCIPANLFERHFGVYVDET